VWPVAGLLVGTLLLTGFGLVLFSDQASTANDLGLAIVSGGLIGAVFVLVEYLLTRAATERSRTQQILQQLHSTTELSGIDLATENLRGAYLPNKNLSLAKMDGALLDGATLLFGNFGFASLIGISGCKADLGGSVFTEARLTRADLTDADLYDSDLRGVDLRDAVLRGARLTNADLTGADLRGADLRNSILIRTQICSVDLSGALLQGADLEAIDYDDSTIWPEGFEPPPPTPRDREWVLGTTVTDWLAIRRQNPRHPSH